MKLTTEDTEILFFKIIFSPPYSLMKLTTEGTEDTEDTEREEESK